MKIKVCAAIVTYNRCELLQQCINSVLSQSHLPDCVVVVDNNSTDNTKEYLNDLKLTTLPTELVAIHLEKNLGGAGGFYTGMQYAFKNNFDYAWLMDDDGYPEEDALEVLISCASVNEISGPVVLTNREDQQLSFPLRVPNSLKKIYSLSDYINIYPSRAEGVIFPFNGTLIGSNVMKAIGLPKAEYFIWGDDFEYINRSLKAGFKVNTISKALFFHPKASTIGHPMLFNLLFFNDPTQDVKLYCLVRNTVRNYLDYKTIVRVFAFIFKVLWFYSFTQPNLSRLKIAIYGIWDAITHNFERHKKFLKDSLN